MHVHFLDPHRPLVSPVHSADARLKLALTLIYVGTCSLTPEASWPTYVLLIALVFAAEVLSRLGVLYVVKRAMLALPFALAAFPTLFATEGSPLFIIPMGASSLVATAEGLSRFGSILLKSWLSLQAAIVLAASTPFPQLLQAMRAMRAPKILVAIIGLMWRYLFVLVDEALRLVRARAARSGSRPDHRIRSGGPIAWRARVTGGMAGNLLVRAFERSERIYEAMLARGYDGEARALPVPPLDLGARLTLVGSALLALLLLGVGSLFAG